MATLAEYNVLFNIDTVTSGDKEVDALIDKMKEADIASGRLTRTMAEQAAEAKKLAVANRASKEAQEEVNKAVDTAVGSNTKASQAFGKMEQAVNKKSKALSSGTNKWIKYAKVAAVAGTVLTVLTKAFGKTREGIELMERASSAGGFTMRLLGNTIVDTGRNIANSVTSTGAWGKAKKFFKEDLIPFLIRSQPGVAHFFSSFVAPVLENDKLLQAQQKLARARAEFLPIQAKYEAQLKSINAELKDSNLTGAEAERLRDKASAVQGVLNAKQLEFARESLRIIKERNINQGGDLTPQQIVEQGQAEAALSKARSVITTQRIQDLQRLQAVEKQVSENVKSLNSELSKYTNDAVRREERKSGLIDAANARIKALVGDEEQIKEQAQLIRDVLKIEIAKINQEATRALAAAIQNLKASPEINYTVQFLKKYWGVATDEEIEEELFKEVGDRIAVAGRLTSARIVKAAQEDAELSPVSKLLGLDGDQQKAANEAIDALRDASNAFLDEKLRQKDTEIQIQRDKINFLGSLQEGATDEQLRLEQTRLEKLTEEREKAAKAQRKIASIEIAANNAVAVSEGIKNIISAFKGGDLFTGIATTIAMAATVFSTISTLSSAFGNIPAFYKGKNPDGVDSVGRGTADARGGSLAILHPNEMVVPSAITSHPAMVGVGFADLPHYVALGKQAAADRRTVNSPSEGRSAANDQKVLKKLLSEQEYTNYLHRRKRSHILIDAGGIREVIDSKDGAIKRVERAFY